MQLVARPVRLLSFLLAALALAVVAAVGLAPAEAGERVPSDRRRAAPDVRDPRGSAKELGRSPRDPVRELQGQLAALQRRVAELEAELDGLRAAAPADGVEARVAALEDVLAVGPGGVTLSSAGKVSIAGSVVDIEASSVQAEAGTATFSGVVNVDTLNARSVVAEEMAPSAGNVW